MHIYRINSDNIRQTKDLQALLPALERGFKQFAIDYYLVGAVSRDVWMSGIHGIAPRRGTKDFDFAIFINDKGVYEQLKQYLLENEGFTAYEENAFVLIGENGMQVDLLPFGAIEDDNRRVTVEGTGFTSVHVDGFLEVYQRLETVEVEGIHEFKVCTLPGYVLLKLIAWDDRPDARRDDITDISDILQYFFEMFRETIWEEHSDLFEEMEQLNPLMVGAKVLGREIGKLTQGSKVLHQRVATILEANTQDIGNSPMADIMRAYFDNTIEECVGFIQEIKSGFKEVK